MSLMAGSAGAGIIATSGDADGTCWRNRGPGWTDMGADTAGPSLASWNAFDGNWNICFAQYNLATLDPVSLRTATLNFYLQGGAPVVRYIDGVNGNGSVTYGLSSAAGAALPHSLTAEEGWKQLDVTAAVADALSKNYDWIVFGFGDFNNSITVAAAEDSQSRGSYLAVVAPEPTTFSALLLLGSSICLRRKRA